MSAVEGPPPFALAATGCPPHAHLALSLAASFHDVDAGAAHITLDRLAACVPEPASGDPEDELRAVCALWEGRALPEEGPGPGCDSLMLDRALELRDAHPLVQALAAIEAGRRRGLSLGLVSNGTTHCVAHTRLEDPLVVRAPDGKMVDGRALPPVLSWRCAHEACALLLDQAEKRWLRCGRVGEALRAAELRMLLPVDDDARAAAEQRLERVRALLN